MITPIQTTRIYVNIHISVTPDLSFGICLCIFAWVAKILNDDQVTC